jgi:hypothetical protein
MLKKEIQGSLFSLLTFDREALRRQDGTRIATPHSLVREKFEKIEVTAAALSNQCFVTRVANGFLSERNFGETLRRPEWLPDVGDLISVRVKATFANNGTGRKAKNYSADQFLDCLCLRSGIAKVSAFAALLPDQYRQGITISGIHEVVGRFVVSNVFLFTQALRSGIGARRSYGFGMVFYEIESSQNCVENDEL